MPEFTKVSSEVTKGYLSTFSGGWEGLPEEVYRDVQVFLQHNCKLGLLMKSEDKTCRSVPPDQSVKLWSMAPCSDSQGEGWRLQSDWPCSAEINRNELLEVTMAFLRSVGVFLHELEVSSSPLPATLWHSWCWLVCAGRPLVQIVPPRPSAPGGKEECLRSEALSITAASMNGAWVWWS